MTDKVSGRGCEREISTTVQSLRGAYPPREFWGGNPPLRNSWMLYHSPFALHSSVSLLIDRYIFTL